MHWKDGRTHVTHFSVVERHLASREGLADLILCVTGEIAGTRNYRPLGARILGSGLTVCLGNRPDPEILIQQLIVQPGFEGRRDPDKGQGNKLWAFIGMVLIDPRREVRPQPYMRFCHETPLTSLFDLSVPAVDALNFRLNLNTRRQTRFDQPPCDLSRIFQVLDRGLDMNPGA